MFKLKTALGATALALVASYTGSVSAGAIIYNAAGTLALGVNDEANLNVRDVADITVNASRTGLAIYLDPGSPSEGPGFYDATSPGCFCEGWGVAANGLGASANEASGGIAGLTLDSFASTASTATSNVHMTALPGLKVEHAYGISVTDSLFEAVVTITNDTAAVATDVRYTRAMDWDIPFSEFSEYVTIGGTATTTELLYSNDDGFESTNPFGARSSIAACAPATTDFTDCGPTDHGALFDFGFGDLAAGASKTFSIFYGATLGEKAANGALAAVDAELYSFGQSRSDPTGGTPATYIFAFAGVGGTPVIPVPGSLALLGIGLLGLGMARRKAR